MSAIEHYMLAIDHDPEDARRVAQNTSIALESNETTLIKIVESLGDYINDQNDAVRSNAIRYLIQVFEVLPPTFLSRQQVQVLCQFLCDRMQDEGALHGLSVLLQLSRSTAEVANMTFRAIHAQFGDLQAYPQSKRFEVLSLVNLLLMRHRQSIRSLGTESLLGLVDVFSGERDPRNLMLVFSMFRIVIAEWNLEGHVENVFDSVFCYFPITFRPPPNDPHGITAQDLKSRLQDCLSASQTFAPYAFPQLLLKLDANSINAKRDVLNTIAACSASFGPHTMSLHANTIWEALKFEVFNAQEDEMSELALIALKSVARTLQQATEAPAILSSFLQPIVTDCDERLQEPQQKQAGPAACILGALASTSNNALSTLANASIPLLTRLYQDALNFEARRAILDLLAEILKGAADAESASSAQSSPLQNFREDLFLTFSRALMSSNADETAFRLSALKCLTLCCKSSGFLDASETGMIVQHLVEIILDVSLQTHAQLKDEAINSLSEVSRVAPKPVSEIAIPAFLAHLPDTAECGKPTYGVLNSISRFSFEPSLTETLTRRLLNKARLMAQKATTSQYFRALLATLYILLGKHNLRFDATVEAYFDAIVEMIEKMTKNSTQTATNAAEPVVARMLGRLTSRIFRYLNNGTQKVAIAKLSLLFENLNDEPMMNKMDFVDSNGLILSTYAFAAFNKEVPLQFSQESFITRLDWLIINAQRNLAPVTRLCILQQIALIVSKFLDSRELGKVEDRLWEPENGLFVPRKNIKSTIRVGFWILKALVLRSTSINVIFGRVLDRLADPNYGMDMAVGFEILLSPDEILAKENGARIGRLAPQRVFDLCLTQIKARLRSVPIDAKPNYIIALSGILKHLDEDIITPRAEELLPLLLQALDLAKPSAKEASLRTLHTLLKSSPESVEAHASGLINRLLNSAQDFQNDTEDVRYHALECLEMFPRSIKISILIPYRRAILKGLLRILDDPRRHVRKMAVDCRTAWLNMDEPDEDE